MKTYGLGGTSELAPLGLKQRPELSRSHTSLTVVLVMPSLVFVYFHFVRAVVFTCYELFFVYSQPAVSVIYKTKHARAVFLVFSSSS